MSNHIMRTAFAAAAFLPACSLNAPLAINTSVAASSADCAPDVSCLSLGWDDKARTFWYETSQGSRLIPEPWTRALTAAKSDKLFWGREHFSKYGYIWNKADAPFPIGFVRDEDKERQFDWIGLNCAACHTSQIENGGTKFRIDDPVKWAAFSSAVLGTSAGRSIVEIFIPRTEMEMVVLSESDRKPLDLLYDKKQIDLKKCKKIALGTDEAQKDKRELLKYKARPLNGAWATAPFLHNGSVPNLRYLLARPENRPKSFYVGSRRFDGDSVGFATDHQPGETTSLFEAEFLSDNGSQKVIPGNDNAGHTHGAGLCAGTAKPFAEESGDCKAMLLYLKSL